MNQLDAIVSDYIRESEVDYIVLPQIPSAIRSEINANEDEEVRRLSLKVVRQLYERGLGPGDYWGGDFDYWPDEGCQAMLDRIEREWIAARHDPNLAEPICWFAPRVG